MKSIKETEKLTNVFDNCKIGVPFHWAALELD